MQSSHNIQRKTRIARLFRIPNASQSQKFYYGRRAFAVPQDDNTPRRRNR